MIHKNNIYRNLIRLAAVPSVSGTEQEARAAYLLRDMLCDIPYFQRQPGNVRLIPLENDPLGRSIVTAFWENPSPCPDTVILTGHYDVVDVEEYGHLKDIAYDAEAVTARISEMPLDEDSRKDWESGEWIFGRGTADMKYGHALCLELLRHFSQEPDALHGNLLYVAVCGEETNSEGMLRAVPFFNELAEKKGLRYRALLLTECFMTEDQANDPNRYIHYGASGKAMPMFLCVGEATHGGEPFLGLDPTLLNAELYRQLSLCPDFCQQSLGETTPPPVCLKSKDLKACYSVSTALYAVSYYNIISVDLHPGELMDRLKGICQAAFESALALRSQRIAGYQNSTGQKPSVRQYEPCVKTFYEVYQAVRGQYQGDYPAHLRAFARELAEQKMELQDICIELVRHTYEQYSDKRPMIILSVIPPYYPDVAPDWGRPEAARLLHCLEDVIAYAGEAYGETLRFKNYYMGLSDLSYTGLREGLDFEALFQNLAGAGLVYDFPFEELKRFSVPSIVLGGYGKDFHKHTERLNRHYNFDVLPQLYERLIRGLLGVADGSGQ